jgi:hypothetical protein
MEIPSAPARAEQTAALEMCPEAEELEASAGEMCSSQQLTE